jgi:hypothetical protein
MTNRNSKQRHLLLSSGFILPHFFFVLTIVATIAGATIAIHKGYVELIKEKSLTATEEKLKAREKKLKEWEERLRKKEIELKDMESRPSEKENLLLDESLRDQKKSSFEKLEGDSLTDRLADVKPLYFKDRVLTDLDKVYFLTKTRVVLYKCEIDGDISPDKTKIAEEKALELLSEKNISLKKFATEMDEFIKAKNIKLQFVKRIAEPVIIQKVNSRHKNEKRIIIPKIR